MMNLSVNNSPANLREARQDPYSTRVFGESQAGAQFAAARPTASLRCAICGDDTGLVLAERAAAMCQISRRLIYRWIEEGWLHFCEAQDGTVLVCGRTLAAKLDRSECNTQSLVH